MVVEADAFKETDVIYQSLNLLAKGNVSGISELVSIQPSNILNNSGFTNLAKIQ